MPLMLNHKLSKNGCLENTRSVAQQIMMSQTNLTVLICITVHQEKENLPMA
jgi:hypothetical protein